MQNLEAEITEDKQALLEASNCLLKFLDRHNNTANEISKYIANQTIQRIKDNKNNWQFTNEAIYKAIVGNKEIDYSSWFSRYWKTIKEISPRGLEEFARDNGYQYFAIIDKKEGGGKGNQTLYFLVAKRVENHSNQLIIKQYADLKYIEISNITPSWWAKWLFNKDNAAIGWRKMTYVLYPLIEVIIGALFVLMIWFIIAFKKTPISAQDIALLSSIFLILFYIRFSIQNWAKLVDDRIVMAPDSLLSWSERNVSLELITSSDGKNKTLRLVRYASQCPICQAEILLDKGEPDFPRRIVGRCKESPREHVYSFDRITRTGNKLR